MAKAIYFDMDGTIANFYGVPNWLECLAANDPTPYKVAKPLVNMNVLARLLNRVLRATTLELLVGQAKLAQTISMTLQSWQSWVG